MSQKQSTKFYSSKQEKLISKYLGWSVVTGSGARNHHPGDIESDEWLGECKTHATSGHKIIFNKSVWIKIVDEAVSKYKFPALFVDDGSQTIDQTWVMFTILPACHVVFNDFIFPVKTNVSFDSLKLAEHRKSITSMEPVIYRLKWESYNNKLVYISSLEDFFWMF